jgi:hypothetical protein
VVDRQSAEVDLWAHDDDVADDDVAEAAPRSFADFSIRDRPWDAWTYIPIWELVRAR